MSLINPSNGCYEISRIQTVIKNGEKLISVTKRRSFYETTIFDEITTEEGFPSKGFSIQVHTDYPEGTAIFDSKRNDLYISTDVYETFNKLGSWDSMGFYQIIEKYQG